MLATCLEIFLDSHQKVCKTQDYKNKSKIMSLSVFCFGEFQVLLFLFRVVLTTLEFQSSGSSSQVTLQSILQLHTWKDLDLACLFPLVPKTQLRRYWNWFFSPLFLFLPFLFTFNIATCLDAKQEEFLGLYQNWKQIDNLYWGVVHWDKYVNLSEIFCYISILFIFIQLHNSDTRMLALLFWKPKIIYQYLSNLAFSLLINLKKADY